MKRNKIFIILLTLFFLNSACQSLQEGIAGSKRSKSSDEFFVKKKNPLVLPPNYDELPKPNQKNSEKENSQESIKDILGISANNDQDQLIENDSNNSLEENILKKIKQKAE
ncbi:DUF3035 domain-containing protein [Candidatus Pelagibacter sp.]|nr:DUF3035 domain-containing protein [Candidatus Pelagibacter sp.]